MPRGQVEEITGRRWCMAVVPQCLFGDWFYQIQLVQMSQSVNQKYVSKHVFPLCHFYLTSFWKHSAQFSRVWFFVTPWTATRQASPQPSINNSQSLLKLVHWVRDAIQLSSSVVPFSSCLQSFPVSGSFQRVGSSHQVAKVLELQLQHPSVLPMNVQDWLPLGLTALISLLSKGLSIEIMQLAMQFGSTSQCN